jgi:hypothetical protein
MAAPATSVHSHDSAQPQILQEPTRVARRRIDDTTHRAPPPPPIRRCRLRFQISCSAHCVDTCICSERAERAHDGQEVHHQHSEEELNMFTLLDCSLYFTRARATGTPIGQEPFTDTPLHSHAQGRLHLPPNAQGRLQLIRSGAACVWVVHPPVLQWLTRAAGCRREFDAVQPLTCFAPTTDVRVTNQTGDAIHVFTLHGFTICVFTIRSAEMTRSVYGRGRRRTHHWRDV